METFDAKEMQALCKTIASKKNGGSLRTLGKTQVSMPRWSTGIADLDEILGGGMPYGRIIEIYGAESSGKTTLALYFASLQPKALYIPIEGTFDADRARQLGCKDKDLLIFDADYGEQAIDCLQQFIKAGIPLGIIDSVPACQPRDDVEKKDKSAENNNRMGGVARLFSENLPGMVRNAERSGTTVILINQVRDKMQAMLYGDNETTPGGRAIRFYTSIRIKVARKSWIEIPNKNPALSCENEKVGLIMKLRTVKNKTANPFQDCEVPYFFEKGFCSFDEVNDIRKQLMRERKEKFNT